MGLAGPKRRNKLSHDPNNTAWARDTNSFGAKIMASQGWAPGQYLGAKDAAHASHYTAANASHIRVMLKDDNMGLGMKRANNNAETFGLSLYSGILGRLNGKTDVQLEKEQTARRDVELRLYQDRRWGSMHFVSAGFLVGDKIEDLKSTSIKELQTRPSAADSKPASPKRKRQAEDDGESELQPSKKSKRKRSKSEPASASDAEEEAPAKKRKSKTGGEETPQGDEAELSDKKSKKDKKDKKKKRDDESADSGKEVSARKLEKLARKEEKRRRKEEKAKRKEAKKEAAASSSSESEPETETRSGTATPSFAGGRHAVRQRYIQQKRMASMNAQALKEVSLRLPDAHADFLANSRCRSSWLRLRDNVLSSASASVLAILNRFTIIVAF